ncbi:substrate-binding domain-containing protein [Dactylosporangium vinaceum]|uniref:Substrate-binding domain-containing protein n=1 Tax=Dactylosporangium vinaceum TaxID=53362 RepID=A0ABV5MJ56_9ACTN|nr:substrate-binding domain-containing protein [Dactylosporangium vinaceum]UAB93658.1 substrate-binding domain-containing protein [Dactylosporangium vinaceum]
MGRHQSGSRMLGALMRGLVLLLAVGLVAGAGWYVLHDDATDADGADCPTTLRVVTASSFSTVVSAAGRELRAAKDCILLDVTTADGRPAAGQVAQLGADVWMPDDAAWATAAPPGLLVPTDKESQAKRDTGAGTTLATSPILMVTDAPTAEKIKDKGNGWLALANLLDAKTPGVRLVVRDPALSGDGLVAAGAVGEAVWLKEGMDSSSLTLNNAMAVTRTVNHDLAATPNEPGEVGLVPEYALLPIMNLAQSRVYLAGADNTALMRYSWFPTAEAARDPKRVAALNRLREAFASTEVRQALNAAGLRGPGQTRPPFEGGSTLPEPTAEPFAVLAAHHVQHVFATWDAEDRRGNLLIAVDMAAPGAGGGSTAPTGGKQSALDVLKAGCRAVGDLMPVGSRLGLWEISPGQPGGYRKLLPSDRLDDTSRAAFTRSVNTLNTHKAGAGLLDTIVAAYQSVRDDWHDDMLNQVFILTDDANKDSANAQAVAAMVEKLKALQDPERPVTISVVVLAKKDAADRLKTALQPLGAYVDNASSADDVQAAFIHVVAGGLHE